MIVLFGVISVIYMPLTHLAAIPAAVTNAAITKTVEIGDMTEQDTKGYYKELYMLKALDKNEAAITAAIAEIGEEKLEGKSAAEYVDQMKTIADDFRFGNTTMLDNPWNSEGIKGINLLWIIPLLSWLTAMGSSLISMYFTKQGTAKGEKQPGQGWQQCDAGHPHAAVLAVYYVYRSGRRRYLLDMLKPDCYPADDYFEYDL